MAQDYEPLSRSDVRRLYSVKVKLLQNYSQPDRLTIFLYFPYT